jgi:diamine N-acetyltransferase
VLDEDLHRWRHGTATPAGLASFYDDAGASLWTESHDAMLSYCTAMDDADDGTVTIRELARSESVEASAQVVAASFASVASDLHLTRENCPTHPSFITASDLARLGANPAVFFGLFDRAKRQIGFVALERASGSAYYLEKLAVVPECRHHGYGGLLMDRAVEYVRSQGARTISISIVDDNAVLKDWYLHYGFVETRTAAFPHLPFRVCFMEKTLA